MCFFFQLETSKWKGTLDIFDSDTGDKNKLNRKEYESHHALLSVSSDFHSIFCDFHTVLFLHIP